MDKDVKVPPPPITMAPPPPNAIAPPPPPSVIAPPPTVTVQTEKDDAVEVHDRATVVNALLSLPIEIKAADEAIGAVDEKTVLTASGNTLRVEDKRKMLEALKEDTISEIQESNPDGPQILKRRLSRVIKPTTTNEVVSTDEAKIRKGVDEDLKGFILMGEDDSFVGTPPHHISSSPFEEEGDFDVTPEVKEEQRSFLGRIGSMLLDKDTQETLDQVMRVANLFFGDMEQTTTELLVGLFLLGRVQSAKTITSNQIETNDNILREIVHYWKFAAAAYGWKLLNSLMFEGQNDKLIRGFIRGDDENLDTLCKHCGIDKEDILSYNWTSSVFRPGHFLVIDHPTESIVLSIRGTFHVKDAMADLIGVPKKFVTGYTHEGILECAKTKVREVRGLLREYMAKYEGYRLIIVGHSLGAGTASLMTILLHYEFLEWDIHCYAYAPPCVLSLVAAWDAKHLITSIILENDVVPRISFESLTRLKRHSAALVPHNTQSTLSLISVASNLKSIPIPSKIGGSKTSDRPASTANLNQAFDFDDPPDLDSSLFPPGTVYHLLRDHEHSPTANDPTSMQYYRLEMSHPSFFCDIRLVKGMFDDHLPWVYDSAFKGMMARHINIEKRNRRQLQKKRWKIK